LNRRSFFTVQIFRNLHVTLVLSPSEKPQMSPGFNRWKSDAKEYGMTFQHRFMKIGHS